MSWGKIYCSTWWGDYDNVRHSIPDKPPCMQEEIVANYAVRVEADGGVVEASQCLHDFIEFLQDN
jgi:hypothetical protein